MLNERELSLTDGKTQSLLKSEALLQECSLWALSNDHWLHKSLSAPAHFIIFVLVLLHPSFQKHLAALQPGQSQRSNRALIYRQQSSTCTASEPLGPCSWSQLQPGAAGLHLGAFWSLAGEISSVQALGNWGQLTGCQRCTGTLQWSVGQETLRCQTLNVAKTIKWCWQH